MFLVFPICFAYTNAKEKYVNDGKRREKAGLILAEAGAAVSRRENPRCTLPIRFSASSPWFSPLSVRM